jgi:hypothetical protein
MDEGMTAIAEEQAKPAIETQQPEIETDEPELNTLENEGDDEGEGTEPEGEEAEGEEGTEPEPELLEIEFNGKKHKIPAELKDGFLMQADYTKKTQAVAEMTRTVEARQAEADANFSVSEEVLQARAALMLHDNQLEQFQNMNWQQLENEDPVGAMSAWRQFQQLKEARSNIAGYLTEQQTQRSAQAEQATANRLRETREFAEKEIKGWSPELDNKITEFAVNGLGVGIDVLKGALNPTLYKTFYLAYLGQQTLAKQAAPPKTPTSNVKPLAKVDSKANPSARKSTETMSMEEYAAHRHQQLAKAQR